MSSGSKASSHAIQKPASQHVRVKKDLKNVPSSNLNNIVEVTEENYTQRFNTEVVEDNVSLLRESERNLCCRAYNCLKQFVSSVFKKESEFSIIVKEQKIFETIQKLRESKRKYIPVLPPLTEPRKTLVLDLEDLLVHSSTAANEKYDFIIDVQYKKSTINLHVINRFGLESFLFQMSKCYEIVVYTACKKEYANKIIENIDKKKRISHVIYRDKCIVLNKMYFLKNMRILGRDPKDVIFVDHNPTAGALQPDNFIQINKFEGDRSDRQLVKIIPFLRELSAKKSVRPASEHLGSYFNRQIRLKFNSLDTSKADYEEESPRKQNGKQSRSKSHRSSKVSSKKHLEEKQKKYQHKRVNSEIENFSKSTEDDELSNTQSNTNSINENINENEHEESACELQKKFSSVKQQI